MLISIFTALIAGSIQDVLAEDITDILKPVPIKNSEYQFHLQVTLRDADGMLISVTETTNGYYIPHDITDEGFDNCFGSNICKKEIVVVDNIKYEKIQYREKYSLDSASNEHLVNINGTQTSTADSEYRWAVRKRVAPTVTFTAGATFAATTVSAGATCTAITASTIVPTGFRLRVTQAGTTWTIGGGGNVRRDGSDTANVLFDARH